MNDPKKFVDFLNLPPPALLSAEEVEARREAKLAEEAEAEIKRRRAAMLRANIPAKDIDRLLAPERLKATTALTAVRDWLNNPKARRLLVLSGNPDAGKTTAAAFGAASAPGPEDIVWLREGAPWGRYVEAELLMGPWMFYTPVEIDGIKHTTDPVTRMHRGDLVHCWLLVIDDLAQEAAALAPNIGETIDVLIRLRCDRKLRTIITTNERTSAALAQRYDQAAGRGQRLTERLVEHARWVDCPDEGLRSAARREQVLARRRGLVEAGR